MKELWYGGTIYTMEKEHETVESVLVEDGKILAVGNRTEYEHLADRSVNLNGATMYPGFVDSHLHIIFHGEKLLRLDLSKATSAEEMLQLVAEAAKEIHEDQWLLGEGWNENNFKEPRIPTIEELDAIRKGPIILTRVCIHQILVNSKALELAEITEQTESPYGGEIGKDEKGQLNGRLLENATNLVKSCLPKEGNEYIEFLENAVEIAIQDLHSKGLTGGHSDDLGYFGHYTNPLTAYKRVIGKKQHFRVNLLRHNSVFEELMKNGDTFEEPFIEPGALKMFTDGAFGGSTAALLEPYADNKNNQGILIHTDESLEEYIKLAREYNSAVAIHAIGDAGADQVIRAIEKYPVPAGQRDRLIHACLLNDDLVARLKKLPIVLDIQPAFVPSDFPWVINRLGQERLQWAYAWRKLIDQGLMCANGTDAPVEDVDPLKTIYAAVERKKPGEEIEGYLPEEKLTRFEAIQLYTLGSAKAICKEHERGLIKPGFDADFTIFDRDLLHGTSEEMLNAKVLKTVVAGNVVYSFKE